MKKLCRLQLLTELLASAVFNLERRGNAFEVPSVNVSLNIPKQNGVKWYLNVSPSTLNLIPRIAIY